VLVLRLLQTLTSVLLNRDRRVAGRTIANNHDCMETDYESVGPGSNPGPAALTIRVACGEGLPDGEVTLFLSCPTSLIVFHACCEGVGQYRNPGFLFTTFSDSLAYRNLLKAYIFRALTQNRTKAQLETFGNLKPRWT
jgi:hypothetical protein